MKNDWVGADEISPPIFYYICMENFKRYIAKQLIGHKLHFVCNCIFKLDHTGIIKDFEITNNEIIFIVDVDGKLIKIGENHPNLNVTLA